MERLISDAEQKFHHYFSPVNEPTLNLAQFVSQQEESFSLNSLTEMDVHLLKDKHFNEMFQDIKRYCEPTFVKEARHLDRYYVLLAGLLRQLLRASGSTFDPYERKLLIERVYTWYRDKRKLLLDYRLKSRRGANQQSKTPLKKLVNDDDDAIRLEDLDARAASSRLPYIKMASPLREQQHTYTTPGTPDGRQLGDLGDGFPGAHSITQLPLFVNQDKKKELFISNKLKQYSRRNLSSSHQRRLQRAQQKPQSAQEQGRSASRAESWSVHSTSRPNTSLEGTTVIPESGSSSNQRFISQPRFVNYKEEFDFTKMGVYSHWLEHRARETEEELENVEFQDTISTWASNRARIEEEIQRRQEASRYSSQTGVTVHKIVRETDNEEESRRHRKRLEDLRQKADAFLDSDSEFSDDERQSAPSRSNPLDSVHADDAQADRDTDEDDHVPTSTSEEEEDYLHEKENQEPIFLSPYNNLHKVTHQFRPPSPLNPDTDLMNTEERFAASKGFVRPMTTGASAIPRTPIIAYHREVDKPLTAEPAVEGTGKQPYRPKTVSVFDRKRTEYHHVHFTAPEKEHFHSVLDREGLIEEPKAKKGRRASGKKSPSKTSGGAAAKKTKGKKGADKKAAPAAAAPPPPEPVAPVPRPPSLLRSAQLDECERIKLSLAKGGWNVPTSIIERSILIPEDLSHEECRSQLPTGAFLRLECVMAEEAAPKKKKATKGKKKKGGKKKKKK